MGVKWFSVGESFILKGTVHQISTILSLIVQGSHDLGPAATNGKLKKKKSEVDILCILQMIEIRTSLCSEAYVEFASDIREI